MNAGTKKNESIFTIRVVGICNEASKLVGEDRLCLIKSNPMLPLIGRTLFEIPFES